MMLPSLPVIAAAAFGTLALWLGWRTVIATRARQAARAAYFGEARALFDRWTTRIEPTGFARASGGRGGQEFDLRALPDTLTFRKLPALWVMVTLPAPLPVRATLDIMARPTGQETFSHHAMLPHTVPPPAGLPDGCVVKSDNAPALPPADLISPHLSVFADPRIKELVVSPRGLRIVLLAEEADRSRYLLFREAEMGMTPLPADRLAIVLDRILALRADLLAHAGDM